MRCRVMRGALVLAAVTTAACGSAAPHDQAPDTGEPVAVRVATVAAADVAAVWEAGGVVQARTTATLAAQVLAPVAAVHVVAGDRVSAGQVLVTLQGRELEAGARSAAAAVAQAADHGVAAAAEERAAQAALALARASHGRIAALHAKRSATAQELDEATAALAAAEARTAAATAQVSAASAGGDRARAASDAAIATAAFLRITAPFAGVVTEKMVEPGNMATPGLPLLRVEDTRAFRLDVRVDESRAGQVTPGAAVEVVLDGAGQPLTVKGAVTEISRAVDADARAALVKIALPEVPGLRSGTFGRARFAAAGRAALVVPADAIVQQGQVSAVFVADQGVARLRLVRLRGTEVQAGLTAGEAVVLAPPAGLADGRRINVGGAR